LPDPSPQPRAISIMKPPFVLSLSLLPYASAINVDPSSRSTIGGNARVDRRFVDSGFKGGYREFTFFLYRESTWRDARYL
jgi:hypothetical protein